MTPERRAELQRLTAQPHRTPIGTVADRSERIRVGLADALAEIDRLTQRWEALTNFIDDCTSVDVKVIQDEIDRLEREP